MANYKRVLLALDFHNDNHAIIEKATKVAADNGAELALLHAVSYTHLTLPTSDLV